MGQINPPNGYDQTDDSSYARPEVNYAWFTGRDQTIRYCILTAPDFGIDRSYLATQIEEAFATWSDYMELKHVKSFEAPKRLALDVNCGQSTDIQFLFGTVYPDTKAARTGSPLQEQISVAIRTDYDFDKGWGKGFVWIAPTRPASEQASRGAFQDWMIPGNLSAVLLHEVGHVYGVSSIAGTIMEDDLASQLNFGTNPRTELDSIDREQELVICKDCIETHAGDLGEHVEVTTSDMSGGGRTQVFDSIKDNFQLLTGQTAQGEVRAEVKGSASGGYEIWLADEKGYFHLPIHIHPFSEVDTDVQTIFTSVHRDSATSLEITTSSHSSEIARGELVTLTGKQISLTIIRNGIALLSPDENHASGKRNNSTFQITYETATDTKLLFTTPLHF